MPLQGSLVGTHGSNLTCLTLKRRESLIFDEKGLSTRGFGVFAVQNKTFTAYSSEPDRREATAGGLTTERMQCMIVLSSIFIHLILPEVALYSIFYV